MRLLVAGVISITLVCLVACSGGGSEAVQNTIVSPTPPAFVSAAAAIGASAEKFRTDVHSFKGTMDIFVGTQGKTVDLKGDMRFREPHTTYLTMDVPNAGQIHELMVLPDMYIGDGNNWVHLDLSKITGSTFDKYAKYAENRGPISYSDVAKQLQQLQQLPNEVLDGKSYWHYQGTIDPEKALNDLPAGSVSADTIAKARSICWPSMDVLMDPDTLLPRRYIFDMSLNLSGSTLSELMTMEFTEYNVDVDIPTVPPNATELPMPTPTPTLIEATVPWVTTPDASVSTAPACTAPETPTPQASATPGEFSIPTSQ